MDFERPKWNSPDCFKAIVERIDATKRVNVSEDEIKGILAPILASIDIFNSKPEGTIYIKEFNAAADEIHLLAEFAEFVIFNSVRLEPDNYLTRDLLRRIKTPKIWKKVKKPKTTPPTLEAKKDAEGNVVDEANHKTEFIEEWTLSDINEGDLSLQKLYTAQAKLRSLFRADSNSNLVTLASLRKKASYNDVTDRVVVNGKVKFNGTPFIPILIDDSVTKAFYTDAGFVYNTEAKDVLWAYINNMHFGVSSK